MSSVIRSGIREAVGTLLADTLSYSATVDGAYTDFSGTIITARTEAPLFNDDGYYETTHDATLHVADAVTVIDKGVFVKDVDDQIYSVSSYARAGHGKKTFVLTAIVTGYVGVDRGGVE